MLKSLIVAASFAFAATSAFAADTATPPSDPYASPIEQCIRDNAAKVEISIADLNQAVDFLVGKVCAGPIADHNTERQKFVQQRNAENMQKLCDEQNAAKPADASKPDASKPDPTKVNGVDYCQIFKNAARTTMQPVPYDPWASGLTLTGNNNPPAAVALASQLLLNLRAARKRRE
jgi:hypothetical protein